MPTRLTSVALLAMALYVAGAHAGEADTPMFSLSGFGTLGLVHSSEDQADFTGGFFQPTGAGHTHAWSADVDSRIAAQVTANPTPQLSAVLQVVSEQTHDDTYQPHVEWANIKYQLTPDFSVRAGRTVLPSFLLSETRKVGYTYMWVRPPLEVYRLLPVTSTDGLDVSYRLHLGAWVNTLQAHLGQKDSKLPNDAGTLKARDIWGLTGTTEYGALTLRVSYQRLHATVRSLDALFDGFRQFGPEGVAIADQYEVDDKPFSFISAAASYDPGQWFVMGEWGRLKSPSVFGVGKGWYASGGYRFGKFMPYVMYAEARSDNLSDPGLDTSAMPPQQAGPAMGLNAALNAILSTKPVQDTISVGGRWDFLKNAALKLQFDHTDIGAGSNGRLDNLQPGYQPGGKVDMFSATIDFVF